MGVKEEEEKRGAKEKKGKGKEARANGQLVWWRRSEQNSRIPYHRS
jgi:hypothetical protein